MSGNATGADRKPSPPYLAFQTLKTFIGSLKAHGIPNRVDSSVLTTMSGSVRNQLLPALRFLGITDNDGCPLPLCRNLVKAYDTEGWAEALLAVLAEKYRPVLAINLETATPSQFSQVFADTFSGEGETTRKAQTFFLNAATEAKIPIGRYIMKNKKPRVAGVKRRPRAASQKNTPDPKPDTHNGAGAQNGDAGGGKPSVSDPLITQLLAKFPTFDPAWPDAIKAKWFEGFERLMKGVDKP